VDKEVEGLTGGDRAIARFALVLAKAPYQVDEALVGEIRREDREVTRFIRVLAWASFSAARRIAKRIADTVVESKMAKETKFKDRIGRIAARINEHQTNGDSSEGSLEYRSQARPGSAAMATKDNESTKRQLLAANIGTNTKED